jgi:hypothetical protein
MKLRVLQLTALLLLPLGSLLFYTLSMTGCIGKNPGIPNIYLVALNSTQEIELRVGYFGLCLHHEKTFACVPTHYGSKVAKIYPRLSEKLAKETGTPLSEELLTTALKLQRNVFSCFGAICGLFFVISLLVCIVDLILRIRNNQALSAQQWPHMLLAGSVVMSTINAAAIMQTANALEFATTVMTTSTIAVRAGIALQVLAWLACGFSLLFFCVLLSPNPPTHSPRTDMAKQQKKPLKISSPIPTVGSSPMYMVPPKA